MRLKHLQGALVSLMEFNYFVTMVLRLSFVVDDAHCAHGFVAVEAVKLVGPLAVLGTLPILVIALGEILNK